VSWYLQRETFFIIIVVIILIILETSDLRQSLTQNMWTPMCLWSLFIHDRSLLEKFRVRWNCVILARISRKKLCNVMEKSLRNLITPKTSHLFENQPYFKTCVKPNLLTKFVLVGQWICMLFFWASLMIAFCDTLIILIFRFTRRRLLFYAGVKLL
jgi:hypothetical protein